MNPALVSGVLMILATSWLGYQRIYRPTQRQAAQVHAQLREEEQTQALRVELAGMLQELERLRKRLPPEPDTEWLVREVGRLAEESGAKVVSIVPQSPKPLKNIVYLGVTLQLVTSYHQLGQCLSALENAKTFLRVDEVEILRGNGPMAQVRLTVSTLYVPPPGEPPPQQAVR